MKPKVYLETTIVSYLTARPSRDAVTNGMIEQTKNWWAQEREGFELIVSDIVVTEASAGDVSAVTRRLAALKGLPVVEADAEAKSLATVLLNNMALPPNAVDDAAHIAVAAVNQMEYMLTWNCRHIANATMRGKIESICRDAGFEPPVICTPEELVHA